MPFLPLLAALPCLVQPGPAPALSPEAKAILDAAEAKAQAAQAALMAHRKAGKDPKDFANPVRQDITDCTTRLRTEQDPQIRQALLLARMTLCMLSGQRPEADSGSQLLKEVSPAFPGWSIWPQLMFTLWEAAKDEAGAKAYYQEALARNPDPGVRKALLAWQGAEAIYEGDLDAGRAALARLEQAFPGCREAGDVKRDLVNYLKTKPGNPAPALSVPSLEDPAKVLTLDTFKGKYVLLDFWATWCGPCRGELPHLHKAWERFKGKPFVILSISHDRKAEDIAAFRKNPATPMPWQHGFQPDPAARKALGEAYGVFGIPKPILLGPDGKVVTLKGLRGEELEKTLAGYLEP